MTTPRLKRSVLAALFVLPALALLASAASAQTVDINSSQTYQVIRGYGGHNGAGWINHLTPAQADTAFGTGNGQIGLSIMRMRIDPDSSNWSRQLPTAQLAKQKGVTLFATPWSPPAAMKTNNNLTSGRLQPARYVDYATHLLNFASYMSSNGAGLYAISVQNEPDWDAPYEGCLWNSTEFINFLKGQGSRFGNLKVIAPESLGFVKSLSDAILNDTSAAAQFDIVGGHLYGVNPSDYPLARSKGKELWMTEHYTTDKDANIWSEALPVALELHSSMVSNYSAYVWWYIRRAYGLITENGAVSKRGYIMSQFAKYVRPGAVRIAATEKPHSDVFVTAYRNAGGTLAIVAIGNGTGQRQITPQLGSAAATAFIKYTTSASVNNGYAGQYTVSNGTITA